PAQSSMASASAVHSPPPPVLLAAIAQAADASSGAAIRKAKDTTRDPDGSHWIAAAWANRNASASHAPAFEPIPVFLSSCIRRIIMRHRGRPAQALEAFRPQVLARKGICPHNA